MCGPEKAAGRAAGPECGSCATHVLTSQEATADRVLVRVDTEQARQELINARLAYVSVSRGRYDAQIYTSEAGKLGEQLSRDIIEGVRIGN